jgi:hypothetical protein
LPLPLTCHQILAGNADQAARSAAPAALATRAARPNRTLAHPSLKAETWAAACERAM